MTDIEEKTMIMRRTNRMFCAYARNNRRVPWEMGFKNWLALARKRARQRRWDDVMADVMSVLRTCF
jgi:hypothetical protein